MKPTQRGCAQRDAYNSVQSMHASPVRYTVHTQKHAWSMHALWAQNMNATMETEEAIVYYMSFKKKTLRVRSS